LRIRVSRQTSVGVLPGETSERQIALEQEMRFAEICELNLGIFKVRYSMKFLMNLTQSVSKVVVLAVGGWYLFNGRTEVGTLVAFLSGLNNLNDP
jgi:ABC-type bacteriocin/lantibiotic exporter with double-glycine peptidase domain